MNVAYSPSQVSQEALFDALPYEAPEPFIPRSSGPVTWTATFAASRPGITIDWVWSAAVYSLFGPVGTFQLKPLSGPIAPVDPQAGPPRLCTKTPTPPERPKPTHNNTAAYCVALGNLKRARESAREGLRLARQVQAGLVLAIALQHLALLAALGGDARRAAQLLGYVEAQYDCVGYAREYTEQWSYNRLRAALRETLSEDEIEKLKVEGAARSEDRAIEEALKV